MCNAAAALLQRLPDAGRHRQPRPCHTRHFQWIGNLCQLAHANCTRHTTPHIRRNCMHHVSGAWSGFPSHTLWPHNSQKPAVPPSSAMHALNGGIDAHVCMCSCCMRRACMHAYAAAACSLLRPRASTHTGQHAAQDTRAIRAVKSAWRIATSIACANEGRCGATGTN